MKMSAFERLNRSQSEAGRNLAHAPSAGARLCPKDQPQGAAYPALAGLCQCVTPFHPLRLGFATAAFRCVCQVAPGKAVEALISFT